ncbi:MAG: ATP-binding protein [Chitinophagaceae bacterium]
MAVVTVEQLKKIDSLKNVPAEQLQWLIDQSECLQLEAGELLFKTGDPVKNTYVIIEGKLRLNFSQNGKTRILAEFESGSITGYLPFSRATVAIGNSECIKKSSIMVCTFEHIRQAISKHYELTEALVHIMTSRVRDFTALQQQNEKMIALGKLSASLAHELNNPAAAISRDADALIKHVQCYPKLFKQLVGISMKEENADMVNNKIFAVANRPGKQVLGMMERSAKEEELADWLADHQITNYDFAESLVEAGFIIDDLDELAQYIPADYFNQVMTWISNNILTEKMIMDIQEASRRISSLVGSVKNYTHMDRGSDKQFVDIHAGIRSTLIMLNHKLKKSNIEIVEDFDIDIPPVNALPGELNQVWTNIIDNAIDAMEINGKGILRIKTEQDCEFIKVTITDNGPGIPEVFKTQIFDPFFTTKEMGKGTGLGLDVVTRIVQQHKGSVRVNSIPANTEFIICFPLNSDA